MWAIVQVGIIILVSLWIIQSCRRVNSLSLLFVMAALWLRLILSAFPAITYPPVVAGLSINALASIVVTLAGFALLPKRYLLLKPLLSIYIFLLVLVVSGVVTGSWKGLITAGFKWLYFLVLALMLYDAIKALGLSSAFSKLIKIFLMPFAMQIASVILGVAKRTESDGSISYIGGYNHEAAFSMVMVAFLYLVCLIPRGDLARRWLWIMAGVISLLLANYRTSMLAVLPLLLLVLVRGITDRLEGSNKITGMCLLVLALLSVIPAVSDTVAQRFADIGVAMAKGSDLISEPRYYTDVEKKLFSARAYIWSQYITAYANLDLLGKALGVGPESWSGQFDKYAHNIFVSYLYEFGVIGLGAIILVFVSLMLMALQISSGGSGYLPLAAVFGYLLLCLSTMPLWNIEGLIGLSVLLAYLLVGKQELYLRSLGQ